MAAFKPGMRIIINGRLDCEHHQTLLGCQPVARILADSIITLHATTEQASDEADQLPRMSAPVMATISDQQHAGSSSTQHTLLIATGDETQRSLLAGQLDADGHTVYEADSVTATVAKLSEHAIDVLILGDLDRPADGLRLLRAIRADEHARIHPSQPVVTLGPDDELTALRAYDSGSDHHLTDSCGYLLLRAVLGTLTRRTLQTITSRHLHVGQIHISPPQRFGAQSAPTASPAPRHTGSSRPP